MSKKQSGMDHLTFYGNHFLASPQAQEIMDQLFDKEDPFRKQLEKQINVHKQVMKQLEEGMKNVALGTNEGDQILPGYMRIPQNVNPPPQNAHPVFPYLPEPNAPLKPITKG